MSLDGFKAFACGVFTNDGTDLLTTTSKNRIDDLETLFQRGQDNCGETRFDAFNAFTEYFTHGDGVGKKSTDTQKLAKANFGRGAEWKREALRVLSNEEIFADSCKRGERLLNDRQAFEKAKAGAN